MTYSGDRSSTEMSHPILFGAAELLPEDLERLAKAFRPSWELDEAPFAGPAMFTAADVRSLQGADGRVQVRQALHANDGVSQAKGFGHFASSRPVAGGLRPNAELTPRPRSVAPAMPAFESPLDAPRFRNPPWIGMGVAAAVLVGIGIWATSSGSSSSSDPQAKAPVTGAVAQPVVPAVPPPAAAPSDPAPAPAAPLRDMRAPPPSALSPVQIPVVHPGAAISRPFPSAKAVARPKASNPTIVRDVPF